MNSKNKIIWEKWKDPLGFDDQEEDLLDSEEESDYHDIYNQKQIKNKKIKCQLIHTPFGIFPVNENTASSEIFNFWTGHTNFALIKNIGDIIEATDGVETLNVFTKYRFRISVGKAFNDSIVMRNINNNVYKYLNRSNVTN